jgi:NTP pyrophosphatase (non-canonical NTP hydrolase)
LEQLIAKVAEFRDQRNWKPFNDPKDLAISLSLEAAELLELFQWRTSEEVVARRMEELKDELADVLYYAFLLSRDLGIDLEEAVLAKLKKNEEKYPIEKAYGNNKKYDEL